MEKRIYGIEADLDINHVELSDEDFMTLAEEQGHVWTIDWFINSFNCGDVSSELFLRKI